MHCVDQKQTHPAEFSCIDGGNGCFPWRRIAVIANRPFQRKALIHRAQGRPLPPWAAEIGCSSWTQALLKFIVAHPGVTCAIPATSQVAHMHGRFLGYGMLAFSVLLLPIIELAAGRSWSGLSFFGSATVPTSIGTLGLAAMLSLRLALLLIPIPALWCIIAALLQLGLGDLLWWLPAVAVQVGVVSALMGRQVRLGSRA